MNDRTRRRSNSRTATRTGGIRTGTGIVKATEGKEHQTRSVRPYRTTAKPAGMGLAFKITTLMMLLVLGVMTGYGTFIAMKTTQTLNNELMIRGATIAQTLAILGTALVEGEKLSEELPSILRRVSTGAVSSTGREDEITSIRKRLEVPKDFLASLRSFMEQAGSDTEIVDAAIAMGAGGKMTLIASISGKSVYSSGVSTPCIVKMGGRLVDTGVKIRKGVTEVGDRKVETVTFRKEITDRRGNAAGEAMVILSVEKIRAAKKALVESIIASVIVMCIIAAAVSLMLARHITRPIEQLVRDMGAVSRGDLSHRTLVRSNDEIGMLAKTFNEMTKGLEEAHRAAMERERLARDLDIAREIQKKLLPDRIPRIPRYDISAFYRAARHVGGDYYDFIPIDNRHLGIVVADVSGKGIAGSLVMTMTRTILRFEALRNLSTADTLSKVNSILAREIRRGMFVTAFYCILDVQENTLTFSSAGHNPMILVRTSTNQQWLLNPSGIALGFDSGPIFNKTIKEEKVKLRRGDRIILYTDGVVEAMNAKKEQFSEQRFYALSRRLAALSSQEFVKGVVEELEKFRGQAEQHDDITISTFKLL